jgi:hypothetical protein
MRLSGIHALFSSLASKAMEALAGRRYSSYSFLTSALDGGDWSASRPGRALPPGKGPPGTHWTGGYVGPRAGMDTEDRGKILRPCRGSNPDRPVVQTVVRHYTDWATPAPFSSLEYLILSFCTAVSFQILMLGGVNILPESVNILHYV